MAGGKDGGAVKLTVPRRVLLQRSRISCWFNDWDSMLIVVVKKTPGLGELWSFLVLGLQTCPQAVPPTIVASPFGPSASMKSD